MRPHSKLWLCVAAVLAWQATGAEVDIMIDANSTETVRVPPSFMGLSMEPVRRMQYMAEDEVFIQLLNNLVAFDTGPINIRWGGHTQDDYREPLTEEDWQSLASLHESVYDSRVCYTLPINLRTSNVSQAVQAIRTVKDILSPDAVYAIGIGNEPDAYPFKHKEQGYKADYMRKQYFDEVQAFMDALSPLLAGWTNSHKLVAGPSLADRNALRTDQVPKYAALGKTSNSEPYIKLITWHYYVRSAKQQFDDNGKPLKPFTVKDLLNAQSALRVREHVLQYARAAKKAGVSFRLDETNSLSHSGMFGVSNTMAAALWLIDHAFNIMQAGAVGMNVHNAGCSPYSPVLFPGACKDDQVPDQPEKFEHMCPNICGKGETTPARVNSPYYGMWFVNKVLKNHQKVEMMPDTALEGDDDDSMYRVYVLKTPRTLRVVIVNKQDVADSDGTLVVRLQLDNTEDYGMATVSRLVHKDNLLSGTVEGITLAGQSVDQAGKVVGEHKSCKVLPKVNEDEDNVEYSISMPPASAAVVVIPYGSGRRSNLDEILKKGVPKKDLCEVRL